MTYTLMVKRHLDTGLRYLCKTVREDYLNYNGSGKWWRRHLKKHGRSVSTRVLLRTDDFDRFKCFAQKASTRLRVASSPKWANLIDENGADGGVTHRNPHWLRGFRHSDETKARIAAASRGRPGNKSFLGRRHTEETKSRISGRPKKRLEIAA